MLNTKEIISVIVISLILAFTISLLESFEIFLYTLLAIFIIIIINILAKKITAFFLDSNIKIRLWEISRFGFKAHQHLKNPFPAGAFFPIIVTAFSFGYLNWMASLVFEVKPEIHKAAKRHGLYSFSEMPEYHIGLIAAAGVFINILFAIIGYLINFPEFAKLNIYFAFFNLIPLSDLDGNKIFFGSKLLWSILAIIVLVGFSLSFVII